MTDLFQLIYDHKFDEIIQIIKVNLDNIDYNIKDKNDNYILIYAVIYNQLNLVKILVENGARIDIIDQEGYSILYYPIRFNYFEILQYLLEQNKTVVGISIVDLIDRNNRIPIHYAIKYKNIKILKELIKYSNLHTTDIKGNNILHMAIYSRDIEILKFILSSNIDINSRTLIGESALHIACNLQLIDMIDILLQDPKIDSSLADYEMDFTPLHYSVNLNNIQIINKLLNNKNTNINAQDRFGNTVLHYAILNNNIELFNLFIDKNINTNLWNIDGNIPLHIAIINNISNLDNLIEKSNLNIQNNIGNCCVHYICKYKLYEQYRNILINKKINIYIKNNEDLTPLDYIKDKEQKKIFLKIVAESYLKRLVKLDIEWKEKWENECKKTQDPKCIDIILKKISSNVKKCSKSYPIKNDILCLDLVEGDTTNYCTFTGSIIDILFGIVYLTNKYKNICSIIENISINENITKHKKYDPYNFIGIEIVWLDNVLYYDNNFDKLVLNCINNPDKQFMIIPIGIILEKGSHAGYLLYDKKLNEIERFEPHGSSAINFNYNPVLLDDILNKKFESLKIKYIKPSDYMSKISLQKLESSEFNKQKIGDPGGFCATWVIWYIEMRIMHNLIPRDKLIIKIIKNIRRNNISFKNIIRNYASNITNKRDSILKELNTDINTLIYDSSIEEYNNIINKILEYIK